MAPVETGNARKFGELVLPFYTADLTLVRTFLIDSSATDFRQVNGAGTGGTVDIVSSHVQVKPARVHTKADRLAGNEFIYDNIVDVATPVTLEDYYYYGQSINYNEKTFLDLSLEKDLVPGAGSNVADKINDLALGVINDKITADTTPAVTFSGGTDDRANQIIGEVIRLRKELNARKIPASERTLVVSSDIASILLLSSQFRDVSQSGSDDALVNATLGRKFGFDIVEDAGLVDGSMIAYHKNAFGLVLRTKAPSYSAIESTVVDGNGFVLNVTIDRDGRHQTDLLTVGTFAGFSVVDPARSVVAKFTEPATV